MIGNYIDMGITEPLDDYLTDEEREHYVYIDKGLSEFAGWEFSDSLFLLSFPHIPVFRGSHMIILLKIPAEIQRILEAAYVRDLADIVIGRA